MADEKQDSTERGQRKRRGRRKIDLGPWLRRMAEFKLEHPGWSALRLASEVASLTLGQRGPCSSRYALVTLLRERWRRDGALWMQAERARRQMQKPWRAPAGFEDAVRVMSILEEANRSFVVVGRALAPVKTLDRYLKTLRIR